MRIGLISDIHGVLSALEAVLADVERIGVDRIICLGDVAFGPQPRETLRRVQSLDCPVIMGNADERILDPAIPASDPQANAWARRMGEWCNSRLRDADRDFLRSFLPTLAVELEGETMLCYHGSPQSYFDTIYATTPAARLDAWFDGVDATILVGGHTHRQLFRQWHGRTLINCGSVGRPYAGDEDVMRVLPWAEYAIITAERGAISVDLRHVAVDLDAIIRDARQSLMPNAEGWIADYHQSA